MCQKVIEKRRHSFILAEVTIALLLSALFISMSLSFFFIMSRYTTYQTTLLKVSSERSQKELSIRRILGNIQLKTGQNDTRLISPDTYSKYHRFIFCFNNGPDPHSEFSAEIFGMIYVDNKDRLLLVTSSIPKNEAGQRPEEMAEVLCEDVEKIVWKMGFESKGDDLRIGTKDSDGWSVNPEEGNYGELKAVRLEVWEKGKHGEPSFIVTSLIASHINPLKIG